MATTAKDEMALKLRLSKLAREKLVDRAAKAEEDVAAYASELIERAVTKPSIDEILAPVRADFAKSGMTEDEIMDFGRALVQKVRDEKKAKMA